MAKVNIAFAINPENLYQKRQVNHAIHLTKQVVKQNLTGQNR